MRKNERSSFGRFVHQTNLPNVLTMIRIALIPVFLLLMFLSQDWAAEYPGPDRGLRWWALIVFLLLMLTDQLDGYLARRYRVITDFGKLADPIADKALMISALVTLNIIGELWWIVSIIIVVRELGITVWRMVLARQGQVVPASRGGKLKTVVQTIAVALFILPLGGFFHFLAVIAMTAAVIITVVTGAQYLLDSRAAARSAAAQRPSRVE